MSDRFSATFTEDTVRVFLDVTLHFATVRRVGDPPLPMVMAIVTAPDRVALMVDNFDVRAEPGWEAAIETLAAPRLVDASSTSFTLTGPGGLVECAYSGEESLTDARTAEWLATLERA